MIRTIYNIGLIKFFAIISSFFCEIILIRKLSLSEYALYAILFAIINLSSLIGRGAFSQKLYKLIFKYKKSDFIYNFFVKRTFFNCLAALFICYLFLFFQNNINDINLVYISMLLSFQISLIYNFSSILKIEEKFLSSVLIETLIKNLTIFLAIYIFKDISIKKIFLCLLFSNFIVIFFYFYKFRKKFLKEKIQYELNNEFSLTVIIILIVIFSNGINNIIIIFLSKFGTIEDVASLRIINTIITTVLAFISSIKAYFVVRYVKLNKKIRGEILSVLAISILIFLITIIFSPYFYKYIFKTNIVFSGMLFFLLYSKVFSQSLLGTLETKLINHDKQNYILINHIFCFLISLIFSLLFFNNISVILLCGIFIFVYNFLYCVLLRLVKT